MTLGSGRTSSPVLAPTLAPALAPALSPDGHPEPGRGPCMKHKEASPCPDLPVMLSIETADTKNSCSQPPLSDTSLSSLSDFESFASHTDDYGEQDVKVDSDSQDMIYKAETTASKSGDIMVNEDEHICPSNNSTPVSNQDDRADGITVSHDEDLTATIPGTYSSASSPFHDNFDRSDISLLTPSNIASKATTPIHAVDQAISLSTSLPNSLPPEHTPKIQNSIPSSAIPSPTTLGELENIYIQPRSSIPHHIQPSEYASQCITAAEMCRLNPYALHLGENKLLRAYISRSQVTTYLNIRNGIVRLWARNPQVAVLRKEAIGCAGRGWFKVASLCYDWLVRNGFINFGCVQYPRQSVCLPRGTKRQKTIVVIGAGMSGLGCARQLDGLFQQYSHDFISRDEEPPRVLILEARNRVGGRVYSKPFESKPEDGFKSEDKRCTAEMGGMIITGFYGNPLNFLVRGQLGLQYHCLRPETTLYDSTGFPVDIKSDQLVEHLFNDSLDRVSEYKFDIKAPPLVVGNVQFISEGRDSSSDSGWTLKQIDDAGNIESPPLLQRQLVSDEIRSVGNLSKYGCASIKAQGMGWPLKSGIETATTINLDAAAHAEKACMGSVFEEAINQYTQILDLNPLHFRLLNWHVANLEYSNATDLHNLSLGGWDIDAGNEWEGKHTMVIGGYQSVARGLLMCPQTLECRFNSPVQKIVYDSEAASTGHDRKCAVICEDGTTVDADYVVCSIPLGVLKAGSVCFEPPLPEWKKGAITRIGYGVLNKVILTYQEAFWETDRDIFGILRDPLNPESVSQEEYAESRGRFFQWFNVSSSSGLPCLLALMAGKAGYAAEKEDDKSLVQEATTLLRKVFGKNVPYPKEAIITRWASDKYSFGSYSSSGPGMEWDDYDTLAKPLGNLFFAGEHTIGTHPATVHGAYMSGLRAASEVFDSLLGPLQVPEPLFPAKQASGSSLKRKATTLHDIEKQLRHQHEQHFQEFVVAKLGPAPVHPKPPPSNVYSFFRRENTSVIRHRCLSRRHYPKGKIPPKDMSQMASKMWRELSPDERSLCEKRYQTVIVEYKNLINDLPRAEMTRQSQVAELREQFDKLFPLEDRHQQNQKDISVKPAGTHKSEPYEPETDEAAVVGIALQEVRDPMFIDTESGTIRLSGLPARKTKVVSYVEDDSDLEGL